MVYNAKPYQIEVENKQQSQSSLSYIFRRQHEGRQQNQRKKRRNVKREFSLKETRQLLIVQIIYSQEQIAQKSKTQRRCQQSLLNNNCQNKSRININAALILIFKQVTQKDYGRNNSQIEFQANNSIVKLLVNCPENYIAQLKQIYQKELHYLNRQINDLFYNNYYLMSSTGKSVFSDMIDMSECSSSQMSHPSDKHSCKLTFQQRKQEGDALFIPYCFDHFLQQVQQYRQQDKKQEESLRSIRDKNIIRFKCIRNLQSVSKYLFQKQIDINLKNIAKIKTITNHKYDFLIKVESLEKNCEGYLRNNCKSKVAIQILVQFINGLKEYEKMGLYNMDVGAKNFMVKGNNSDKLICKHLQNKYTFHLVHLEENKKDRTIRRNKLLLRQIKKIIGNKHKLFEELIQDIVKNYQQSVKDSRRLEKIHNIQLMMFAQELLGIIGARKKQMQNLEEVYELIDSYSIQDQRQDFLQRLISFKEKSQQPSQPSQHFSLKQQDDSQSQHNYDQQSSKLNDQQEFYQFVESVEQLKDLVEDNKPQMKELYYYLRQKGFSRQQLKKQIERLGFQATKRIKKKLYKQFQKKFQCLRQLLKNSKEISQIAKGKQVKKIEISSLVKIICLLVNYPNDYSDQLNKLKGKQHHLKEDMAKKLLSNIKKIYQKEICQVFRTFLKQLIIDYFIQYANDNAQSNSQEEAKQEKKKQNIKNMQEQSFLKVKKRPNTSIQFKNNRIGHLHQENNMGNQNIYNNYYTVEHRNNHYYQQNQHEAQHSEQDDDDSEQSHGISSYYDEQDYDYRQW